jgi:hypothetical protein
MTIFSIGKSVNLHTKSGLAGQHIIYLTPTAPPVAGAHLQLFGGRGLIDKKYFCHYNIINHLISITVNIMHPDDGNVDCVRRMYAKSRAKIS